jgi:cbb3-type cytochrome oxidase subunit 3
MMKLALSHFPIKMWPMAGLILFMVTFIVVVLWVNRRGSDGLYRYVSHLPLDESNEIQKSKIVGDRHE